MPGAPATSADALAAWTWERARLSPGLGVNLHTVAGALGVREVRFGPGDELGSLILEEGGPIIRIRADDRDQVFMTPRQRFSLAHELGHLALHEFAGLSLREQMDAPDVERCCDRFAALLLAPREAVRQKFPGEVTLHLIDRLARRAALSTTSAFLALEQDKPRRSALLAFSVLQGRWRISAAHRVPPTMQITSTVETASVIAGLSNGPVHSIRLPVRLDGADIELPGQVRLRGHHAFALLALQP